jgi:hypothetical protein
MAEDPKLRTIAMLQDPGLRNLQERWFSWRGDGEIPLRVSFDPIDFPRQIPLMQLGEIVPEANALRPYDVVLRYLGSGWVDLFDAGQLTNTKLSDLGLVYGERWFALHDLVVAARKPLTVAGSPYGIDKDFLDFEILGLPLSRTGRDVDYVLLALAMIRADA